MTAPPVTRRIPFTLRCQLSVLWLLEWGITGSLLTYLPIYFTASGIPLSDTGPLLAVGAVGLWVAPIVTGQICDRWMSTERYLGLAHLFGGITLLCIPVAVEAGWTRLVYLLLGLFAASYLPTMPLASALTFRHLPSPDLQFGKVRVWGTVGWVVAGVCLSIWLQKDVVYRWIVETYPETNESVVRVFKWLDQLPGPHRDDAFHIAAVLSFTLSSFCLFLPHTPPLRLERAGSYAPLKVLRMFLEPGFLLLAVFSFLLGLIIPLYSLAVPPLLENYFPPGWVPAVMTIGQISEFPALLLLPWFLKRWGLKGTFALGILAWAVRFGLFALSPPWWGVLAGVALHGVCHVFLIIVIQLFIDRHSPQDSRASAQNLFAFITLGIAMPLGMVWSQPLLEAATDDQTPPVIHFDQVFLLPAGVSAAILLLFWLIFPRKAGEATAALPAAPSSDEGIA